MEDFCRKIPNDFSALVSLAGEISAYSEHLGVPRRTALHIDLAVEELVSNIIKYGFDEIGTHQIEIEISSREKQLDMTIRDDGRPFDPTVYPPRKIVTDADNLDDLPVGGWGVSLVRQTVQSFTYARENGNNVSRLVYVW